MKSEGGRIAEGKKGRRGKVGKKEGRKEEEQEGREGRTNEEKKKGRRVNTFCPASFFIGLDHSEV